MEAARMPKTLDKTGFDGEVLRQLRKERGLRREDVATGTGLSFSGLGNLELGLCSPNLRTLARLADFYGVPITDFLAESS
jgi:transcriptional regulator with XRE-family HTH domain